MKKLEIGMNVEINPRSDRTRKLRVQGTISKILTKANQHPHGLLVNLESGEIGRVKKILDQESETPSEKTDQTAPPVHAPSREQNLQDLILGGENHRVEFKAEALWSANFTKEDIKNHRPQSSELHTYGKTTSKMIISKAMAGFLNSDGGTLVIGVRENKQSNIDEIAGIEKEYKDLKDASEDGYRRMIVDTIKTYFPSHIFNHLNKYFFIHFETIDGKTVCGITLSKSDKRVFLKLKDKDHFFIRIDATTRELTGEQVVEYCLNRFG